MRRIFVKGKYFIGKSYKEDLSDFQVMYKADTLKEVERAKNEMKRAGFPKPKVLYSETFEVRD